MHGWSVYEADQTPTRSDFTQFLPVSRSPSVPSPHSSPPARRPFASPRDRDPPRARAAARRQSWPAQPEPRPEPREKRWKSHGEWENDPQMEGKLHIKLVVLQDTVMYHPKFMATSSKYIEIWQSWVRKNMMNNWLLTKHQIWLYFWANSRGNGGFINENGPPWPNLLVDWVDLSSKIASQPR